MVIDSKIYTNMKKLSKAQLKVMSFLGKGWSTVPGNGMSIMINGERICNVDTLIALQKLGFVEQKKATNGVKLVGEWMATPVGKAYQSKQD